MKKRRNNEILVGITGRNVGELKNKILEADKFKIRKVALFLEILNETEKLEVYELLLSSNIKEIPLVHIRNDMKKEELEFLSKNFKTKCFTIHESSFKYLSKWEGFHDMLFLEMNYDNHLVGIANVKKIGGFCVDLSHFKSSEARWTKDFEYIFYRNHVRKYFVCNHLNGYSPLRKRDLHTIRSLKNFNYLKTLPKFIFGKYIAIETFNSISEQIKFKKYVLKLLRNKI